LEAHISHTYKLMYEYLYRRIFVKFLWWLDTPVMFRSYFFFVFEKIKLNFWKCFKPPNMQIEIFFPLLYISPYFSISFHLISSTFLLSILITPSFSLQFLYSFKGGRGTVAQLVELVELRDKGVWCPVFNPWKCVKQN
jgi:hypothetical protein